MRRVRCCLFAAAAVLVTLSAGHRATPAPQVLDALVGPQAHAVKAATVHSATTADGFELSDPHIVGVTPAGLRVYLAPNSANPPGIAAALQSAVTAIAKQGIPISWGGVSATEVTEGVVTVTVKPADCAGLGDVVAYTQTGRTTLPSGSIEVTDAQITVCPMVSDYPVWVLNAAMKHEMGHAMGLDHFNGVYAGTTEVMNYAINAADADGRYHAGDANGFRYLAAGTAKLRAALTARMHRPVLPIARLHLAPAGLRPRVKLR